MYEMKVVWQWSVPNSCSEPPVLKNGVFHDWHVLNGFSTVVMYMLVCSGVTSLGSGWAYPRAPGLRGHSSEGEHIFKTLFYFVDPHNYALFGCPLQPSWACKFWVPLSNLSWACKLWVPPSIVQNFSRASRAILNNSVMPVTSQLSCFWFRARIFHQILTFKYNNIVYWNHDWQMLKTIYKFVSQFWRKLC